MNVQLTRTVKVQVDMPQDAAPGLLDLQARVTAAYNDAAAHAWDHPDIKGAVQLHHAVYRDLVAKHGLKSQFVCNAQRLAMGSVAALRERQKKGKTVSCPRSDRLPIPYDARTMTVRFDRQEVSLATMGKRLSVPVLKHRRIAHYDAWATDAGKLSRDAKGRWWLSLTFTKEVETPAPSPNVIGCDRGIVVPAALSNGKILGDPHWHAVDRRYFRTQSGLQSKGTKSAKRRLKLRAGKWQRFRSWCDHNVSKHILDTLSRGTTLALEDLTNIRQRAQRFRRDTRRRLHAWSFRRQQDMLAYKAPDYGVAVVFVDARYTSQRCSSCGHTSRKNRPSRGVFACEKCKHTEHADLNAARNIAANWSASQRTGAPPVAVSPPNAADDKDAIPVKVGSRGVASRAAKGVRHVAGSPKPRPEGRGCLSEHLIKHRGEGDQAGEFLEAVQEPHGVDHLLQGLGGVVESAVEKQGLVGPLVGAHLAPAFSCPPTPLVILHSSPVEVALPKDLLESCRVRIGQLGIFVTSCELEASKKSHAKK